MNILRFWIATVTAKKIINHKDLRTLSDAEVRRILEIATITKLEISMEIKKSWFFVPSLVSRMDLFEKLVNTESAALVELKRRGLQ